MHYDRTSRNPAKVDNLFRHLDFRCSTKPPDKPAWLKSGYVGYFISREKDCMSSTIATPPIKPSLHPSKTLFGHPTGLYVLFFTEMWERFSFYAMKGIFVLFMVKAMMYDDKVANGVYGAYLGFVYSAPLFGGMLADRFLGQRRAILIGAILMATAHFCLAINALLLTQGVSSNEFSTLFYIGLGFLAAGNGFFKPNISTIVGSLYEQNDPRRDGAFTIFYMGINIGATLSAFMCQVAETRGWYLGFLGAGLGMILSQVIFSLGRGHLQGQGLPPRPAAFREPLFPGVPKIAALFLGIAIFVPVAGLMISKPKLVQDLATYIAVPVFLYLFYEATRGRGEERGRMMVIIILCLFAMMFFGFFELAGSALNLFADRNVERNINIFGRSWEAKASFLTSSINPALVILLGIPFAKLWVWLNRKNMEPSSPLKFALGLLQLAASFVVLYFGAKNVGPNGKCHLLWFVLAFFLQTTGELCLSPVGLSTITKLSPARLVGLFMGTWFLASALGNVFAGWVGGRAADEGFAAVFQFIAISTGIVGILLLLLSPLLKKMMHGVK